MAFHSHQSNDASCDLVSTPQDLDSLNGPEPIISDKEVLLPHLHQRERKQVSSHAQSTLATVAFLTTKEAAHYLNLAAITLAMWRSSGKGPPYSRYGRLVRYSKEDLDNFMSGNQARETCAVKVLPGTSLK